MNFPKKLSVISTALSLAIPNCAWSYIEDETVEVGTVVNDEIVKGVQFVYGTTNNIRLVKDDTSMALSGGYQVVENGGIVNNTIVDCDYCSIRLYDGATSNHTVISGLGYNANMEILVTATTAVANDTVVNGGYFRAFAGVINRTILNAGGFAVRAEESYGSTPTANDSTVNGGIMYVESNGASANNTTLNGGMLAVAYGGTDNNTTVNGGVYLLGDDYEPGAYSNNLIVNSGGHAYIVSGVLTDSTVGGTMKIMEQATLQGRLSVTDSGAVTVYGGANTSDASVDLSGSLILGDSGGSYAFNALTMSGGSVVYAAPTDGYSSLTLASLSGSGSFYMNTAIADRLTDSLTVAGQANGDFSVYVADTGVSPSSAYSLTLIQTGGGDAQFSLGNDGGRVDLGTYQYQMTTDNGGNWFLTPATDEPVPPAPPEPTPAPAPTIITPSTSAVLSMATVDPLIFQSEMDTVRNRLNGVHSANRENGMWGASLADRRSVSDRAGADYTMDTASLTIGADHPFAVQNATLTGGLFFNYAHSDVDFNRGGDGDVDTYGAGAYASYLHHSGFYLNGIAQFNRFKHDVSPRMSSGERAYGDYDTNGYGMNLEAGKYFYFGDAFIAPYTALTGFIADGKSYRLSNGMKADVSTQRSLLSEAGARAGYRFSVGSVQLKPYVSAAAASEMVDNNDVRVNDDGFTNDLSGVRGIYQAGVDARLSRSLSAHASGAYADGKNVEAPWAVNIGFSYSF
ncbi:autotransporter outer membrane beta-barrel domain-containing protein [Leminorella grimontii]|uniref:autotransporter outer membrane beta-barrel domain-containing protein n=1 Tax=Leminorella grimontii TaxID=82981 RepID=UPI0020874750|nr:autotransporter outer membrane beta-barrel domain-containing protein [Leminorella grimontii]GKX58484.1 ABC transporter ATP-binding protein [Leminorella grimontii]